MGEPHASHRALSSLSRAAASRSPRASIDSAPSFAIALSSTWKLIADPSGICEKARDSLSTAGETLAELREIYRDPRLGVPAVVFNANRRVREPIAS